MAGATSIIRALQNGPLGILQGDAEGARRDLTLDLFAFAGTVAVALVFRWQARDLIWGLWVSSLTVGYATIVSTIYRGARTVAGGHAVLALIGGLGALAFFTFHFGMFHFVHGVFLNAFFPILDADGGFASLPGMLTRSAVAYWPLILASFISRFSDIFPGEEIGGGNDPFIKPYGNVIRMHILIFVFAGLHALDLAQIAIIPVLAAYFFPWKAVREHFFPEKG